MKYRLRLWACSCCGEQWNRKKREKAAWWKCRRCADAPIVARRTEPRYRPACRHVRLAHRREAFYNRYGLVPRTKGMRALRPTRTLRLLWNAVRAAKTTPSLLRRLNTFTAAITQHLRADQPRTMEPGRMFTGRPTLVFHDDGTISRHLGGHQGTPAVVFRTLYREHGVFERDFFRGVFEIAIDPTKKRAEYASVLDGIRATFLHELQHFIDSEIQLSDENHGRRFQKRLGVLTAMFSPTENAISAEIHRPNRTQRQRAASALSLVAGWLAPRG